MPLFFRIMGSAIWTVVALIYLTSGAPAVIKPAAQKDNTEQNRCVVFDYIVLPTYGDAEAADQKSYNLTIPLEVCYVTNLEGAAPLCQEAHELLHNISSCSSKVKMLEAVKKHIAEKSKTIVIEPQVDDVCHGFVGSRNIFTSSSFARKLSDPVVCPLICQEAMKKACTFLLWGHQVQAAIHDIWEDIDSKEPSDIKAKKFTEKSASVTEGKPSEEIGSANKGKAEEGGGSVKGENIATAGGDVSATEKRKSSDSISGGQVPGAELQKSASGGDSVNSISERSHETVKPQSTAEVSKPLAVINASEQKNSKPKESSDTDKVSTPLPSAQQVNADRGEANTVSQTPVTTSVTVTKTAKGSLTSVQNGPQPTEGNQEESAKQNKASTGKSEEHESSAKSTNGILKQTVAIVRDENNKKENEDSKAPEGGADNGISRNSPAPQEEKPSTVDAKRPESPVSDDASNVDQEAKDGGKNSKDSKILTEDSGINTDSPKNEENPDVDISGTNHNDDDDANKSQNHDNASDGVSASDKGTEGDTGGEGSSVETLSAGSTYHLGDLGEGTSYFEEKGKGDDDDDADSDQSHIKAGDTGNDDSSNVQSSGQQTNLAENNAGSSNVEETGMIAFPAQEDTHFFFYFVTIIVFAIGGYVLFHNKQKIFALIIEGRHERRRRSGASYRKLETK